VFSHAFNIPIEANLTVDAEVFGAFRVRNGLRLYNAVDDFAVGIPEPASTVLLTLAMAALPTVRWRMVH
jgi:hypothetical protein